MQIPISAEFLADLDLVCPKSRDGAVSPTFFTDLETVYADAQAVARQQAAVSVADLAWLGEVLSEWRSQHELLLKQHLDKLPADDPLLSPISLFRTMDYGRLETAHTQTLAWLLGNKEHGFGDQLLEALLNHLSEGRTILLTHVDGVESEHRIADGRIDIVAWGRWEESGNESPWWLVIEAKIDAEESEEQLSRYEGWLKRLPEQATVVRLFVTPDGREPGTGSAEWQSLSFQTLASVFHRVLPRLEEKPGYHFLRYYLTGVLGDVCGWKTPISSDCKNPHAVLDYLRSVTGASEVEDARGDDR